VDLQTDVDHCGTCDTNCGPASAGCANGQCLCSFGTTDCGDAGCRDLLADPRHCGICGDGCQNDEVCDGGGCVCRPGLIPCNGNCIDPLSNNAHCGDCNTDCLGDNCYLGQCTATDCNNQAQPARACDPNGNSCVTLANMNSNPLHCGDCGDDCNRGEVCSDGNCENFYPATPCTTCPCNFCGNDLCCTYPGPGDVICVQGAQVCP